MADPLSSLPGYLLRRASAATLAELNQRLMGEGVNHADASLMLVIHANPGITQSEAGRMLGIQRANMVPFVARLETRGWLQREQVDGRSQGLSLTGAGATAMAKWRTVIDAFEAELLERVPAELRCHVVPILRYLWNDR